MDNLAPIMQIIIDFFKLMQLDDCESNSDAFVPVMLETMLQDYFTIMSIVLGFD